MSDITTEEVVEFIDSIKERIPIDQFDLDGECVRQVVLYEEVSSMASAMRSQARRTKEVFDSIKAQSNVDIRKDPEKFGMSGKVTESAISNAVEICVTVQAAKDAWLSAEENSNALDSILRTVEQRKSMLRDLVQLFIFQYYHQESQKPVARKDLRDSQEEAITAARDSGRKRRRKSKESEDEDD